MSTSVLSMQSNVPRRVPGEEGIWVIVFGDMIMFSLFFIIFLYYRGENIDVFVASQARLNQGFGALNTVFMLSSSWFVATAVRAARKNLGKVTAACFALAFLCGLGFVTVKFFEYGEKIRAGITFNTNDFFMYYYIFTGIHLVHVLIGMVLVVVMGKYSLSGNFTAGKVRNLETGVSFWHLVDLLWIVLFALLYLIK